jgi:hypothetical protein
VFPFQHCVLFICYHSTLKLDSRFARSLSGATMLQRIINSPKPEHGTMTNQSIQFHGIRAKRQVPAGRAD